MLFDAAAVGDDDDDVGWVWYSSVDLEKEKEQVKNERARSLKLHNDELSRELSNIMGERDASRRAMLQSSLMLKQARSREGETEEKNRALERENAQLKFLLSRTQKTQQEEAEKGQVLGREVAQIKFLLARAQKAAADVVGVGGGDVVNFVKSFHARCSDAFPDLENDQPAFFAIGSKPDDPNSLALCLAFFDGFVDAVQEFKKEAQETLDAAGDQIRGLNTRFSDAAAKNDTLVAEYQRLEKYSKETDQLLAAAANEVEGLKEDMKLLREEMDKAELVMTSQREVNDKLRTRMAWKSKAEEQVFVDDGRKLSAIIEGIRNERDKFQGG
jgi:predicted RNase H-like nuclease (RuvC/YqgF family)